MVVNRCHCPDSVDMPYAVHCELCTLCCCVLYLYVCCLLIHVHMHLCSMQDLVVAQEEVVTKETVGCFC